MAALCTVSNVHYFTGNAALKAVTARLLRESTPMVSDGWSTYMSIVQSKYLTWLNAYILILTIFEMNRIAKCCGKKRGYSPVEARHISSGLECNYSELRSARPILRNNYAGQASNTRSAGCRPFTTPPSPPSRTRGGASQQVTRDMNVAASVYQNPDKIRPVSNEPVTSLNAPRPAASLPRTSASSIYNGEGPVANSQATQYLNDSISFTTQVYSSQMHKVLQNFSLVKLLNVRQLLVIVLQTF